MNADTDTYYSLLEVKEYASSEEIKTAYRRLAREYHPDTLPPELRERRIGRDAETNFKLINEAYKVLSDSQARSLYDKRLRSLRAGKEVPSESAQTWSPPPAEPHQVPLVTPRPRMPSSKAPPSSPKAPLPSRKTTAPGAVVLLLALVVLLAAILDSGWFSGVFRDGKKILALATAQLQEHTGREAAEAPKAQVPAEVQISAATQPREGKQRDKEAERPALIPAGEFQMDAFTDKGEPDPPPRKVYLDAFYMDKTEVTAGYYTVFAKATGREILKRPPNWNTDNHPVVNVEWGDADAYCKWAGGRLPTEAEWEKAALGGTPANYGFGDDENGLSEYAWHDGNSNSQAHPVGQKQANQYGLYDMQGNVWEWVSGSEPRHYTRGGSWSSSPRNMRRRYWHFPGYSNYDLGFRCVTVPKFI